VRREDLPWFLDATRGAGEPLGGRARLLLALLEQRGALFPHELRAFTGLSARELGEALWELVSGGRLTCDGFAALRGLLEGKASAASGRWSLLRPFEAEQREPDWLEKLARQYLRRYGIVFRDLLGREPRSPPWRDLLQIYRRLEARGEIRGGRFVAGMSGEQFAAPEAIGLLRDARRAERSGALVSVSGADPLNLVGILTPGARLAALTGNRVLYRDGVPLALFAGGEVRFLESLAPEAEWAALLERYPSVGRQFNGNRRWTLAAKEEFPFSAPGTGIA